MAGYLWLIDTNTSGPRCDVTPLFANYEPFSALVTDLLAGFADVEFDCVAGIDALGFILGAAMAIWAEKGLVPIRKGGKLPVESDSVSFVDYTGASKSLELRVGAIEPGTRVLVVDEWIETGAQIGAAVELIEGQGGIVVGIAAINMDDNKATRLLQKKYKCRTVWRAEQAVNSER
ncbi:MAG: hypothetical protein B6I35_14285 [Anaerolineaceae bacterium 4572_32.2]|nr:MAG: hypothetical protein B6I35_14285 [Anaerolineaceae bacterium 4572_32.2]HEY72964.1 adenine phosphoribosyltransferase [Thermoflexia bacterium]